MRVATTAVSAKEHNGVIEIGVDAKIVPTHRNQIEEKWKEEIKTKMTDVRLDPREEDSGAECPQPQDRGCAAGCREGKGNDSG